MMHGHNASRASCPGSDDDHGPNTRSTTMHRAVTANRPIFERNSLGGPRASSSRDHLWPNGVLAARLSWCPAEEPGDDRLEDENEPAPRLQAPSQLSQLDPARRPRLRHERLARAAVVRGQSVAHRLDHVVVDLLMAVVVRIAERRLLSASRQSSRRAVPTGRASPAEAEEW